MVGFRLHFEGETVGFVDGLDRVLKKDNQDKCKVFSQSNWKNRHVTKMEKTMGGAGWEEETMGWILVKKCLRCLLDIQVETLKSQLNVRI